MTSKPLVSVVLPTYNRASSVGRAIQSVLQQTHTNLELLVIDDASTDETTELVANIRDDRLRYIRLPRNQGVAAARNKGIELASSQSHWIAFQDSDDEWLAGKLEQQLAEITSEDIGIVIGSYYAQWDNNFVEIRPRATLELGNCTPDILDGWPIITPVWLVRKDILRSAGGFDGSYCPIEDWDLIMRMSDHCKVTAAPLPLLKKYGSPDSICSDERRLCNALDKLVANHYHRWNKHPEKLAKRLVHIGCMRYRPGQRAPARRYFLRAMSLDWRSPVPYSVYLASFLGSRVLKRISKIWPQYTSMALAF